MAREFKKDVDAICRGREKYEIYHRWSLCLLHIRRRSHMESDALIPDDSFRRRQYASQACGGLLQYKRRHNSKTLRLGCSAGLRTRSMHQRGLALLLAQWPAQRPLRLWTLWQISSHLRPEAGWLVRLAFLRVSSSFCQSWTGTASGVAARSSHKSSTSWSFSDGLRSKIEVPVEFIRNPLGFFGKHCRF